MKRRAAQHWQDRLGCARKVPALPRRKSAAIIVDCGAPSFATPTLPTYNDRRKFTKSCWFFGLKLLKLITLWLASDVGYKPFAELM
jgi:hypothetical protein